MYNFAFEHFRTSLFGLGIMNLCGIFRFHMVYILIHNVHLHVIYLITEISFCTSGTSIYSYVHSCWFSHFALLVHYLCTIIHIFHMYIFHIFHNFHILILFSIPYYGNVHLHTLGLIISIFGFRFFRFGPIY